MRILIFLLFLLPLSLIGQVESQFNGTLNVFSGSRIGSTNTFTISGIFNSTTTSYTSSQSDTGDIVQVQSGSRFYWLHIYSIASNSGGVITCNVRDSSSTLTTFPLGNWNIFRPTTNRRLPLTADGISNAARASAFNTLALRVDQIASSGSSSTNCEQTITKAAHGFRKWTPIFWNGSTYIRPTADSLVPDFVVVDSLTANTFKVANCGIYTTALTNGLYWFTNQSPGYSLTADTTKVPLFQVLNGKLLLQPIVGFNLMSGSGDVTRDELADTAAAIRADFPNGIISALPLGDVNINANGNSLIFKKLQSLKLKTATGKTAMSIDTFSNGLFFSLNKTVPGTNLGSLLYFRDTTGIKDNAFYFGQIDYSFSQNQGGGHQMIFGIGGDKVVGGDKSYFGVRNDTSGTIPIVRMMYGDRYSAPSTPDMHLFRGAVPNSALVSDAAFRIQTSSASGKLSADIDNSLFVRENGKVYIGEDSTFSHNPLDNSTVALGELILGYNSEANKLSFSTGWQQNINADGYYGNLTIRNGSGSGFQTYHLIGTPNGIDSMLTIHHKGVGVRIGTPSNIQATLHANFINGSNVNDVFRLDNTRTRLFNVTTSGIVNLLYYSLPHSSPNSVNGSISTPIWTGLGATATPSFLRSQHNVATGTTDGSGDLTVTFASAMPDATYTALCQSEGNANSYTWEVHTKTTASFKIRVRDSNTKAVVTATSITFGYEAKDY